MIYKTQADSGYTKMNMNITLHVTMKGACDYAYMGGLNFQ